MPADPAGSSWGWPAGLSWARAPMLNDAIWLLVASGTYRSRPSEETETSRLLARATIDGSHVRTAGLWRFAVSLLPSHSAAPQVIATTAPDTTYV